MTGAPKLSIVTISYNDVAGLARTIDSVARQTYEPREHIVIDGGSGDDVHKLLSQSTVAYWQSRPDGGRYDAMNQGISHATGDAVWLMHSGDTFARAESAAVGMSALGSNIRTCWGYGRARIVGDPSRAGVVWGYIPFDLPKFALGIRPIPHQASLFGIDLTRRIGPYDTDFGLAADHLHMLKAATLVTPTVIDQVLCDFDAGGAGSVRPQSHHYSDIRRALDVADYYPLGGRTTTQFYSRLLEWSARTKLAVRTTLADRLPASDST